jgi:hypothetical protein
MYSMQTKRNSRIRSPKVRTTSTFSLAILLVVLANSLVLVHSAAYAPRTVPIGDGTAGQSSGSDPGCLYAIGFHRVVASAYCVALQPTLWVPTGVWNPNSKNSPMAGTLIDMVERAVQVQQSTIQQTYGAGKSAFTAEQILSGQTNVANGHSSGTKGVIFQ